MTVDKKEDLAFSRRDRYLHALEALLELPATELGPAMNRSTDLIIELTGADKCDVFIYEPESNTLVAVGSSDTPMSRRQHALGLNRLPLVNRGRDVEVYETGRTWLHNHQQEDPGELPGLKEGLGIHSHVSVPLEVGGKRRGVLCAQSSRPDFFTEDDVRFFEAVSRWIGAVAHRVELSEALTRNAVEQGRRAAAEEIMTVLAHDMNNHLFPIRTRLELIHRRAVRNQAAEHQRDAAAALHALQGLSRLVSDLLDVGRLDQGIFTLQLVTVDLMALVTEVGRSASTPHVEVQIRGAEELVMQADPGRLRQVLENLVANAVKHSPEGVPVVVDVAEEKHNDGVWARVTVSDQGPGIPPQLLPRIFERFVSGTNSSGLGLGLYLAQRIAAAHGGRLEVISPPGKGASFVLRLPTDPPRR